ncbi:MULTISPECIES: DctP family TRAP transporter solute-binding subunit [unclassified Rhizobium]|uniref:DctP family TRAP transporter solute-binding subunit n=1 Tax=unclassified Rhizobium TaxID=2613769 RepID=UPI000712F30E|nr:MULTISPECIES: DctP family TRAP transporter solute-binding subunit [unclassified Rhizobium]KQS85436.1 ABC transporter substrate-binding protein [Rhizobium sp. Leaf386]KQU00858.1 ABC transporter substrate-binding protein [Rhizobium sp. Leaf453]
MRHYTLRSLIAAAALMTASIAHAETLTLSTPDADTSEITLAAKKFAEIVSTKTNGELTIKVFPNGTLYGGDPSAGVKQLAGGSLDMLLNSTSLYATFNPKFTAIAIPYQFRDIEQLRAYLDSDLGQELQSDLGNIGIKGVDLWSRPLRQITNSKLPITSPADMKGMKLRVPNNPLWVEFFGAMGAAPTPMAFAEVYNALQLKVVDGQENPINVPVSAKLYEVQTYATISNHIADAWVLGMNPARYDGLSDAFKAALNDAAKETEAWKAENDAADIEKSLATLKANGMEVNELTDDQRKAFVDIAASLEEKFSALVKDQSFFDRTRAFATTN